MRPWRTAKSRILVPTRRAGTQAIDAPASKELPTDRVVWICLMPSRSILNKEELLLQPTSIDGGSVRSLVFDLASWMRRRPQAKDPRPMSAHVSTEIGWSTTAFQSGVAALRPTSTALAHKTKNRRPSEKGGGWSLQPCGVYTAESQSQGAINGSPPCAVIRK
jgi:hypothetical protein